MVVSKLESFDLKTAKPVVFVLTVFVPLTTNVTAMFYTAEPLRASVTWTSNSNSSIISIVRNSFYCVISTEDAPALKSPFRSVVMNATVVPEANGNDDTDLNTHWPVLFEYPTCVYAPKLAEIYIFYRGTRVDVVSFFIVTVITESGVSTIV